jgi:hypothetical protein
VVAVTGEAVPQVTETCPLATGAPVAAVPLRVVDGGGGVVVPADSVVPPPPQPVTMSVARMAGNARRTLDFIIFRS